MDFLYALFLALGATAFVYSKLGRRAGYGNESSIIPTLGIVFVISLIVTYTIFKFILHI